MVSIRKKKISGKEYLYAEYSFRLPNGQVKKISKLIGNRKTMGKEVKDYFFRKEIEAYQKQALEFYKEDNILTKEKILKIESYKAEYRQLIRNLTKKQMKDILDRFTVNFTYESNAIEGNSLTLKDVTLIINEKIVPKGKDLREVYETRNTRIANEMLFHNKIKINLKDILKIHSTLIRDTGVSEGFKKLPNFLLMRNVKTVPPEKTEDEMRALVEKYNELKETEHPIKLAADFHGRFEKIHPFEDGNGRVGRILINAILLEKGYPPLIIRKTMRLSYFNVLEAYDNGHKSKLQRFLLEKFEKTFKSFFKVYVDYM
jgi:Fic family protein